MATLEERLAAMKAGRQPAIVEGVEQQVTPAQSAKPASVAEERATSFFQNLNVGLANTLGAPVDMVNNILRASGVVSPESTKPFLGSEQIKDFFKTVGSIPEQPKEPREGVDKFIARAGRLTGETALPFAGAMMVGQVAATKSPLVLNEMQKAMLSMYQKPWKAAGAETTAILAGTVGGEAAAYSFPDNHIAEVVGELIGGVSPVAAQKLVGMLPGPKMVKAMFTDEGAQLRAAKRVQEVTGDLDKARQNVFLSSELDLDPITATGDAGLMALEKAALESDPKLADRVAKLTNASMHMARNKVLSVGNPADTVDFLHSLRRRAAAEAQRDITALGNKADPITSAKAVRSAIERSLADARSVEKIKWEGLPAKGMVDPSPVQSKLTNLLEGRTFADDPEDIPKFVTELLGGYDKKGKFVQGKAIKQPEVGVMKAVRSRLQSEMAVERAKDAPNRNKIRILGELQESIFDSISQFSPEYKDAVDFSRQLNEKFTRGKVGDLLGYERTGELTTSAEGTLDFLMSGNKDDVRMGLRQIAQASPQAVPIIEDSVRGMFNLQAIDVDSGALNVANARRFLTKNEHVLNEFPQIKAQIEQSIRSQRVVDELVGKPIGDKLSTYMKEKSVAALYLDGTPETAMQRLVTAKNDQGAGALMKKMVDMTKQDASGKATKGLKAAFGEYLLKHSELPDVNRLSGDKFIKMFTHLNKAARELYTPDEVARLYRIGTELKKIEARSVSKQAPGGVISDLPNKIIEIVGGTFASRVGAQAGAGTSGASLRTAGIFKKEFDKVLGRLTNDGAKQLLLKAVEDPVVLRTLLMEPTPSNLEKANKVFSAFLSGQALTGTSNEAGEKLSLEERLKYLQAFQKKQQRAVQ